MRIVLVVDDEPMLRMLAIEMLEDAGHIVVDFSNAAQAIAYCDEPGNDVAAVVTDINMPGDLDGLDLAR
ncbi:response regulator, partial [Lichenihabitans sp. Uapishka_5]|uniref:response regulator n=1 Tax=Lichenihabitans sp. Uapishka_5 TaxID=3037302 RepID=UPI0029E82091